MLESIGWFLISIHIENQLHCSTHSGDIGLWSWNLIGQVHTQMFLITESNWNLWSSFFLLWISTKRQLKYKPPTPILLVLLIYHFEVFWTFPAMQTKVNWYVISIDVNPPKKYTSYLNSFLRYCTFRNLPIWLVKSIFHNKSKARTTPDTEIEIGSQISQSFSFQTVFR